MTDDQRYTQRSSQELPVRLTLRADLQTPPLAGPAQGSLANISTAGAAINLAKIFIDNHHLFYAPQDNPDSILFLDLIHPENPERFISIPVRPVWFDRTIESEESSFVMGVEFSLQKEDDKAKQLIQMIRDKQQDGGNWLQSLVEKLVGDWREKTDPESN
jgi:hypothetical protein